MMELSFERIAQIIAIAAVGSKNSSISRFYLESDAEIKFSEYVKSQVHLNVVNGLFHRQLREYVETLWFLSGKTIYEKSALNVLRYFYSDIANFLINNGEQLNLFIKIDTDYFNLERVEIDFEETTSLLRSDYEKVKSGELDIAKWKYAPILDHIRDADDLEKKFTSYAFAHVLLEECKQTNMRLIESR